MNADAHTLTGAYVLDALTEEEEEEFRAHLDGCPSCRQEVAELQETATRLGLSVTEPAPESLRAQVLQAVHETRQAPPTVSQHRLPRQRWPWLLAAAAAVLIVAGGVFGLMQVGEDPDSGRQSQIAAVMTAPDARSAQAELRGGGTLTVVTSDQREKAVALAQNLPQLSGDRVYQLWLVDPDENARPAEVLLESARSGGSRLIPSVRADDQVAITREPAGGSEQPTMTPLAVVNSG